MRRRTARVRIQEEPVGAQALVSANFGEHNERYEGTSLTILRAAVLTSLSPDVQSLT